MAGNPLATGGLQNNVVSDKEDAKRKGKKTKKMIRVAGGQVSSPSMIIPSLYLLPNQVWEDQSLLNWDSNDYRLFAGDLGNDVTDEVLNFFPFSTVLHLGWFSGFVANIWPVSKLPDGEGSEG